MRIEDFLGRTVEVGDLIAYLVQYGNTSMQRLYEVVSISPNYVTAVALQSLNGMSYPPTKPSKLHTSLFQDKAVLVGKKGALCE